MNVQSRFDDHDGVRVLVIECSRSPSPVFVKDGPIEAHQPRNLLARPRMNTSSGGLPISCNLLPDHRGRPGPLLTVANRVSIARTAFFTHRSGRFRGRAMDGRLVRSAKEPQAAEIIPLDRLR